MAEDIQKQIDELVKRTKSLEGQVQQPSHYHNGFDSNQIAFVDIYQKKLYVHHTIVGTAAATAANYGVFYIAPVACLVTRIQEVHQTAGTDGGAVTLNIEKLTSGVAPDSGSTILTTALSLKATINTVQTGGITVTSSAKTLAAGDRLCMKDTGTLTAVANVTVLVELQF
jgi:hypothetical protein